MSKRFSRRGFLGLAGRGSLGLVAGTVLGSAASDIASEQITLEANSQPWQLRLALEELSHGTISREEFYREYMPG